MPKRKRVTPWLRISITHGNVVQIAGLLGAVALGWHAGREGTNGTRFMVASRLLAYFCEHAFFHWLIGRVFGIRFSGYGAGGSRALGLRARDQQRPLGRRRDQQQHPRP